MMSDRRCITAHLPSTCSESRLGAHDTQAVAAFPFKECARVRYGDVTSHDCWCPPTVQRHYGLIKKIPAPHVQAVHSPIAPRTCRPELIILRNAIPSTEASPLRRCAFRHAANCFSTPTFSPHGTHLSLTFRMDGLVTQIVCLTFPDF